MEGFMKKKVMYFTITLFCILLFSCNDINNVNSSISIPIDISSSPKSNINPKLQYNDDYSLIFAAIEGEYYSYNAYHFNVDESSIFNLTFKYIPVGKNVKVRVLIYNNGFIYAGDSSEFIVEPGNNNLNLSLSRINNDNMLYLYNGYFTFGAERVLINIYGFENYYIIKDFDDNVISIGYIKGQNDAYEFREIACSKVTEIYNGVPDYTPLEFFDKPKKLQFNFSGQRGTLKSSSGLEFNIGY